MPKAGESRRFRHSIRFKLLLVSLTLLVIPWAGYRYIQETESFLRSAQESMLLGTAQAVAAMLRDRWEMFTAGASGADASDSVVYIHPLHSVIQLDGYLEDWQPYLQNRWQLGTSRSLRLEYLVGERENYLYLLFLVHDDRIVYQQPGESRTDRSDYLDLALERPEGGLARYRITTTGPGWVNAFLLSNDPGDPEPVATEDRISGEWQENSTGYQVELKIPRHLVGPRLALGVGDVDDPRERTLAGRVSTAPMEEVESLGWLVTPNPEITRIIGGLEHANARIWVLDRHRRVLARRGQLTAAENEPSENRSASGYSRFLSGLFRLVLDQPTRQFEDERAEVWRIQGGEVDAALVGKGETRRRATPDGKAVILSAAWPIQAAGGIAGVVLVEQTTNRILSLQNAALERLFGITLLFFTGTALVLLGFATFLAGRIRRLRDRVEAAVTPDGRILQRLSPGHARDEIGDLDRSFSGVLNRLSEYNHYLEAMASRLAHELRTPLTVVKSSLENLDSEPSTKERTVYLQRARDGTERLGLILHRMREATRLEQLLQQTEPERYDLGGLLAAAYEGYRTAFPDTVFELERPTDEVLLDGAPELISQALDKLVNNARDFHTPGTPIRLELQRREPRWAALSVSNQGPSLPEAMGGELFSSMVSLREHKGEEPHLGLGLYLVRLVCEFHGGRAEAENLPNGGGVCFRLLLPLA